MARDREILVTEGTGYAIKGWLECLSSRVWQQSLAKQPTSAAGRLFHAGGGSCGGSHAGTGKCRQIICSAMGVLTE